MQWGLTYDEIAENERTKYHAKEYKKFIWFWPVTLRNGRMAWWETVLVNKRYIDGCYDNKGYWSTSYYSLKEQINE